MHSSTQLIATLAHRVHRYTRYVRGMRHGFIKTAHHDYFADKIVITEIISTSKQASSYLLWVEEDTQVCKDHQDTVEEE